MRPSVCLGYLFGAREAIRAVASSRAALPTGIVLVLLTAIARNYDQLHVREDPVGWIFGPLLFSLVSGTWLYAVAYGILARRRLKRLGEERLPHGWVCFMGLFWMTAPIAWLYAIPVERFLDSLTAAKANVALLSIVSLWRVLLMSRVLQVLCGAPFFMGLVWVLLPAAVEVMLVFFFGGGFAKRIMTGMGGMRHSPEEEVLLLALETAFGGAFWVFWIALVLAIVLRPSRAGSGLPVPLPGSIPWKTLTVISVCWVGLAIGPQRELARNVEAEGLVQDGQMRAALEFLSARRFDQFAPSRPLPPKPYEREMFRQLPQLFGVVRETDAPWVRRHLLTRLDQMHSYLGSGWGYHQRTGEISRATSVSDHREGLAHHFEEDPDSLAKLVAGLARLPEGRTWLATNDVFVEALSQIAMAPPPARGSNAPPWSALAKELGKVGVTNLPASPSSTPTTPPTR